MEDATELLNLPIVLQQHQDLSEWEKGFTAVLSVLTHPEKGVRNWKQCLHSFLRYLCMQQDGNAQLPCST